MMTMEKEIGEESRYLVKTRDRKANETFFIPRFAPSLALAQQQAKTERKTMEQTATEKAEVIQHRKHFRCSSSCC